MLFLLSNYIHVPSAAVAAEGPGIVIKRRICTNEPDEILIFFQVMSDKKRVPPVMGPASRTLQQQQQVQQQQARAAVGTARFAAAAPSANATVRAAVANLPPPMPTTRWVRMRMSWCDFQLQTQVECQPFPKVNY